MPTTPRISTNRRSAVALVAALATMAFPPLVGGARADAESALR